MDECKGNWMSVNNFLNKPRHLEGMDKFQRVKDLFIDFR